MFLLCFAILPAFQNPAQCRNTNFWVYNSGQQLDSLLHKFSLNKICIAWARYDYAHVRLYNLLYKTDPRIDQLRNSLFTQKGALGKSTQSSSNSSARCCTSGDHINHEHTQPVANLKQNMHCLKCCWNQYLSASEIQYGWALRKVRASAGNQKTSG